MNTPLWRQTRAIHSASRPFQPKGSNDFSRSWTCSIITPAGHKSPVATRSREIATLRALGFNATSVVTSVLAESLLVGLVGGLPPALRAARQLIPTALRAL